MRIDIEIRPHNRKAIEKHEMFDLITMIEGDSVGTETLREVKNHITEQDETVLVILDSCHDYDHVLSELKAYSKYVSVGYYIVVTDSSQEYLNVTPRAKKDYPEYCEIWDTNNPKKAAEDFVNENPNFEIVEPEFPFLNEGNIDFRVTHWPSAFVKRLSQKIYSINYSLIVSSAEKVIKEFQNNDFR